MSDIISIVTLVVEVLVEDRAPMVVDVFAGALPPVSGSGSLPANAGGVNAPVLTGTAQVSFTLSVVPGTWTGTPTPTFSYQWMRNGTINIGTNSTSYLIVTADVGATIRCDVTGTNVVGNATAGSNSSATVVGGNIAPVNTSPPTITGSAVRGNTITRTFDGGWTGSPTPTLSFQWKRSGVIVQTGGTSYTTVIADQGSNITCAVTATNIAGNDSAVSNSIGPITAPAAFTPTYEIYFF